MAGKRVFIEGHHLLSDPAHAFVGVVMVVHEALATLLAATPRRQGSLGKMHLGPIQQALGRGLAP